MYIADKTDGNMATEILVVDDEPGLLKVIARLLSTQYHLTTVSGGQEAIDAIVKREGKFDVIICDLNMPKPDGSDLYHYVASHYPPLKQSFIFMTGGAFTPEISEFMKSVSCHRLEKPFSTAALITMVEECLQGTTNVKYE